ncbi:MAG TPA: uracil-DNA glycosylase [Ktedonobacterales bacterium]|jgi:DNA polymerase|nr:uracil-DNA glycosylase [Ktedonobacterales bacterium]
MSASAEEALRQIAAEVQVCTLCALHLGAKQGVPGSGNAQAEVMLIGEAPSYYDDRRGYPFSGPTGPLLDELLALAGLDRTSVYLTNVVKHRLPSGQSLQPDEIAACAPYLDRQIAAINPKLIVTLGRYAMARFFLRGSVSKLHGQARKIGGRIVLAMYNPAAALHQEQLRRTIEEDFRTALPAALAEARRPTTEEPSPDEDGPEQLSLF